MDHWADYVIFVSFLTISMSIGLYHALTGDRQRTNEEFIMANHKLKVLPTTVSIIVSYMSALTILGAPAEMYSYGWIAWPGHILMHLVCTIVTTNILIPWIYRLKLTSVYSYFYLRYGNRTLQTFSTSLGIMSMILFSGTSVYAPSMSLETATGFPLEASIPIVSVVCAVYTTLGGIRAVIWTDVFQSVVMLGGILAIFTKVFMMSGSVEGIYDTLLSHGRLGFNVSPDPTIRHTLWTFVIGGAVIASVTKGLGQPSVQRYSALPRLGDAQKMIWLWWVGLTLVSTICMLTGLILFAYYAQIECDPIASHQIKSANQIIPLFVAQVFGGYPGFSGLFLATMYSATLSTVSSTMSAAAANCWTDIIEPRVPRLPEHQAAYVSKGLVLAFSVLTIAFAFTVSSMGGSILAISVGMIGVSNGPILGMFLLAGIKVFRRISWKCVFCGGIAGFAVNMWLMFGAVWVKDCYHTLPPSSVAGCNIGNGTDSDWWNNTFPAYNVPGDNVTSSLDTVQDTRPTGIDRFNCLSYLHYALFGSLLTVSVAFIMHIVTCRFTRPDVVQNPLGDELFISVSHLRFTWKKHRSDKRDPDRKVENIPLKQPTKEETINYDI